MKLSDDEQICLVVIFSLNLLQAIANFKGMGINVLFK
jgi:hypothetical protein